jgi:hypothetical protein
MHKATLLTNDQDYIPLLDALSQYGMYVTLWYVKRKTNKELIYAADAKHPLNLYNFYSLTTKLFRKKFTIPSVTERNSTKGGADYQYIEEGTTHSNVEFRLYKWERGYAIVLPSQDPHSHSKYTHVRYHDLEILKRFIEYEYSIKVETEHGK